MEVEDTRSQSRKSNIIRDYLLRSNVRVFSTLCSLREQGWQSEEADRHFMRQRTTADTSSANPRTQHGFYKKMLDMADELNHATGIFSSTGNQRKRFLDLCMAPGAFSEYILRQSPWCEVDGITLPVESGGHDILLRTNRRNISVSYTNITLHHRLLPNGYRIPRNYPDLQDFYNNPALPNLSLYDVVICDGQKLRTHEEGERRPWEPGRLLLSQIILGLTQIKPGGSMLILLHRVEQWNTVSLMYRFSQFSDITLYKPTTAHATRSSFYLLARNIRPQNAMSWVEHLKYCWYRMTFDGEEGRGMGIDSAEELEAEDILRAFGPKLIELGYDVWRRQMEALSSSKWIRGSGSR